MRMQNERKTRNSSNFRVSVKTSSKYKFPNANSLARGAGFEPARPNGPQA